MTKREGDKERQRERERQRQRDGVEEDREVEGVMERQNDKERERERGHCCCMAEGKTLSQRHKAVDS